MTRPIGAPCWMDLLTSDTERAREFYAGLFGWTAGEAAEQFGGYFMFSDTPEFRLTALKDGDETIAGIMDGSSFLPAGQADRWGIYIKVTDTDAALATITRLGGTVTEPAMDTPYGRLAGAADPTGAAFKIVG